MSNKTYMQNKNEILKKILKNIETGVTNALRLIESGEEVGAAELERISASAVPEEGVAAGMKIVEGVFDGTHMVGSDGKQYAIPPNYASKSKLVEGDMLKLTISPAGKFIYKQIGPVERERVVGTLAEDSVTKQFIVSSDGKTWQVLTASITYFKGEPGDEAVILIPRGSPSRWSAVENVIKKL